MDFGADFEMDFNVDFSTDFHANFNANFDVNFNVDFGVDFDVDSIVDFNALNQVDFTDILIWHTLRFRLITKCRSFGLNERPTSNWSYLCAIAGDLEA